MARVLLLTLAAALALPGADKKEPPSGRGESESVEVTATVYADKDGVKQLLGTDLDGHYVVVDARVRSRFGKEIDVRRDDFMLRTDKDGERSTPFAASQIAGRGALVVAESGTRGGGGLMGDSGGPVWGGMPGTNDRPRRIGGDGGAIGNTGSGSEAKATASSGSGGVPPLQKLLESKILPEGKTEKSVSGLLYFPLGKQKVKDLELIYTAPDGKVSLRFK